jgi:ribosomal protein L1
MKNESFLYYPDIRFKTRMGKICIFEIMDTEARKQALVVAHVVEAYFTPNVLKVIFIVRDEKDQQTVNRITDVVLGSLEDLGRRNLNQKVRFYYAIVPPEESKSIDRVAKALVKTGILPRKRGSLK